MRVFVTGGAGYVGSHCCKAFAQAGHEVVAFDNLSRGWRDFVRYGPLIEGDLLDTETLKAALARTRPDAVAHFAALAYVGESVADPAHYYRNNFVGTLNLLDAMRQTDVGSLLFSSTCATYGAPRYTPIDEGHPQNPINPYGHSKLMVEQALSDYAKAYGINAVALRYFNAAGADPDGELGERHEPETHAIPLAICSAMEAEGSFQIFGSDYDTRDGTAIRDYIHVSDLADAHGRALSYVLNIKGFAAFNLGTGIGVTVKEIADTVARISGRPMRCTNAPRRLGDPAALVAKAERAREVLGWSPRYSDIEHIVETAWRWHARDKVSR